MSTNKSASVSQAPKLVYTSTCFRRSYDQVKPQLDKAHYRLKKSPPSFDEERGFAVYKANILRFFSSISSYSVASGDVPFGQVVNAEGALESANDEQLALIVEKDNATFAFPYDSISDIQRSYLEGLSPLDGEKILYTATAIRRLGERFAPNDRELVLKDFVSRDLWSG